MNDPAPYVRKVRFSDTDYQGHVFNANYFVYFDDALTDYMDALGVSYARMGQEGHDLVLARAECDFRSSGQLGESLITAVRVERIGKTSITFALEMTEESSGRTVAQGKEVYVILDRSSGRPTVVPAYLRGALTGEE